MLAYIQPVRGFLELSEYGSKGWRSFVIIPEGNDGKGWVDCRVQL
jgi:hypothetical protein